MTNEEKIKHLKNEIEQLKISVESDLRFAKKTFDDEPDNSIVSLLTKIDSKLIKILEDAKWKF